MTFIPRGSEASAQPPILRWAGLCVALAIAGLAACLLLRVLHTVRADDIARAIRDFPPRTLLACALLTAASFTALGLYDCLAIRVVAPERISPLRAWFAGAAANAMSNTLGFHAVTAAAVRYRIYARSGLSLAEVAYVTSLSWSSLALGFATMLCVSAALAPGMDIPARIGGTAMLCLLVASLRFLGTGRAISIWGRHLRLPSRNIAAAQMVLGCVEMAAAVGGLYILLPEGAASSFPAFSLIYIGAVLLGIASHVPGGLGVFEATMLSLSPAGGRAAILAALLLYRCIYNFLPFLLAAAALGGEELRAAVNSRADSA